MPRLIVGTFVALTLAFATGCTTVKVTVHNDSDFDPSAGFQKALSGPNFAIQVFNAAGSSSEELLTTKLTKELRTLLEPRGYVFKANPKEANLLFLFTVNDRNGSVRTPAESSWGVGWSKFAGSGSMGAGKTQVTEWMTLRALDCAGGKPRVVVDASSWLSSETAPFLKNDERFSSAVQKMVAGSLFSEIGDAPAPRNPASACELP